MTKLNAQQVAAYRDDGVLFPFAVLSPEELAAGLASRRSHRRDARGGARACCSIRPTQRRKRSATSAATRDPRPRRGTDRAEHPRLGRELLLKEPHSDAYVSWHQDATYWGLEPADIVTAWVAFTPSTVESGCMRVVPGTHNDGILDAPRNMGRRQSICRAARRSPSTSTSTRSSMSSLKPGEMSLHHVKIAHNSEPNRVEPSPHRLRHPLCRARM